jgi:hypothetical protein
VLAGRRRYKRLVHDEGALGRQRRLLALVAGVAGVTLALLASVAAPPARATPSAGCSSFGPTWAHSYNARAIVAGNPVRVVAACCRPTEKVGINHCLVTVTLTGTLDRGCELVDIGPGGLPSGPGTHERCVSREQAA